MAMVRKIFVCALCLLTGSVEVGAFSVSAISQCYGMHINPQLCRVVEKRMHPHKILMQESPDVSASDHARFRPSDAATESFWHRREIAMLPLAAWSLFSNPSPSAASESQTPVITDKVFLDLRFQAVKQSRESNEQVDDQAPIDGRIVIGLFGNDAPETVALFKELFAGRLITPCQPFEEDPTLPARAQLGKRKMDRMCQASASKPISLEGSQVRWRLRSHDPSTVFIL
jgi:hypothetical protein